MEIEHSCNLDTRRDAAQAEQWGCTARTALHGFLPHMGVGCTIWSLRVVLTLKTYIGTGCINQLISWIWLQYPISTIWQGGLFTLPPYLHWILPAAPSAGSWWSGAQSAESTMKKDITTWPNCNWLHGTCTLTCACLLCQVILCDASVHVIVDTWVNQSDRAFYAVTAFIHSKSMD